MKAKNKDRKGERGKKRDGGIVEGRLIGRER